MPKSPEHYQPLPEKIQKAEEVMEEATELGLGDQKKMSEEGKATFKLGENYYEKSMSDAPSNQLLNFVADKVKERIMLEKAHEVASTAHYRRSDLPAAERYDVEYAKALKEAKESTAKKEVYSDAEFLEYKELLDTFDLSWMSKPQVDFILKELRKEKKWSSRQMVSLLTEIKSLTRG